jgi:hypothetical protein
MELRANASTLPITRLWVRGVLLKRALTAGSILLCAVPAAAQQRPLEPGTQVRITAPEISAGRIDARFQSSRADTLYIDSIAGLQAAIPLHLVHRLEARQPRSRAQGAWRGAGYGFAIPLAIGLVANMELARARAWWLSRSGPPWVRSGARVIQENAGNALNRQRREQPYGMQARGDVEHHAEVRLPARSRCCDCTGVGAVQLGSMCGAAGRGTDGPYHGFSQ